MKALIDLWRGIWRHPLKTGQYIFTVFSILFTLIKAISHFFPTLKIEGPWSLAIVSLVSIGCGLKKVWKPSKVEIPLSHCNTIIEVCFGDLFEKDGIRAIAVNEYFDSKIGKPVSDQSLHGMFLTKCFGGHADAFDKQVTAELALVSSVAVAEKVDGKKDRYPIGSTAMISVNADKYLAFALAHSDPTTCKASADVTMMWTALHHLWQRARAETGGYPLNLPLVGSGLSGVGLPTRDLLNLIILSAITETKAKEITQRIRIVLHKSKFDDLDLRDVKQYWRE